MSAGHSAVTEAARYRLEAEQYEFQASKAREMHRNYMAAASTERRLGEMLAPLEDQGFRLLTDRSWPGSTRAQVDFVLVGPSGVFVVDAKSWADVSVQSDRVFQGQAEVTERFDNIASLAPGVEAALAEVGLPAGEVRTVAVFMNKRGIQGRVGGVDLIGEDAAPSFFLKRGGRLTSSQIDVALAAVENHFPLYVTREQPFETTLSAPVIPISPDDALITVESIENALLAGILAKPIEEWMAFLHPDQARLARRSFNGPSRIRGAAGTGKTVVGLHRAVFIARTRPGKVLVTTFVKTLPAVLNSLTERMAPEVADRIEFSGIHGFALKLLRSRGVKVNIDGKKADLAFASAWRSVGLKGELARLEKDADYWKEEIVSVLKGRGLTDFEQYAGLARVGRRKRLTTPHRIAVWDLYCAYNAELRSRDIHDFADVILLAERSLHARPLEGYSAIVIDEAQDLTCAMIRMLHSIVGDRPDGLNLIGDGQQTIYPGGFTLAEANVSIAGRGVIMTKNYRNTCEIVEFAASLVAGDEFLDIEGASSVGDKHGEIVRHGAKPSINHFASRSLHDVSVVEHVRHLIESGTSPGDIGVLAATNWATQEMSKALAAAKVRSIDLLDYTGRSRDAVKVGTIKRAKGLEFKQVLVVRTAKHLLDAATGNVDTSDFEKRELDRRELYVAMTRARDGLWVGVA
ncbi:MAG: UvrD-helicase domain-containing protein [Rhodoglobus sp.]